MENFVAADEEKENDDVDEELGAPMKLRHRLEAKSVRYRPGCVYGVCIVKITAKRIHGHWGPRERARIRVR